MTNTPTPTFLLNMEGTFLSQPCKIIYVTHEYFPLIVRACNAHDDLVSALKMARSQLKILNGADVTDKIYNLMTEIYQ